MTTDPDEPAGFIPLDEFKPPGLPTQEVFRRLLGRVQALVARSDPKPFIADDKLKKATLERLEEVVAPPACGPLLDELDRAVATWRARRPAVSHVLPVVLPPCDENAVVETWARQAGHQVLEPPSREALVGTPAPGMPVLEGEGLLVVARLEQWFLRHRNGLQVVRRLLAALDALERPVVVGCNGWAWAFLARAVDADMLLPDAQTFRAFDAARLHRWFHQLAGAKGTDGVRFRLPGSGEDVLEQDEGGVPRSSYLQTLAGRSLGIPWVAWHMWRRSLQMDGGEPSVTEDAKALATDGAAGEQTLWVAALEEYVLPGAHRQTALLVLHALLIHGPLTAGELRLTLPVVGESNILPVLAKAGFLERRDALFLVRPAAYPAIRAGLAAAGFPLPANGA